MLHRVTLSHCPLAPCSAAAPQDPRAPNVLSHTIQNVLLGRMQPFPNTMSAGCQALILGLLRTDPQQRTTLHDLARSPWLLSQAQAYGKQVQLCRLLLVVISLQL